MYQNHFRQFAALDIYEFVHVDAKQSTLLIIDISKQAWSRFSLFVVKRCGGLNLEHKCTLVFLLERTENEHGLCSQYDANVTSSFSSSEV